MSAILTTARHDLSSRTWRQWWLAWPTWFRIGSWALAAMMLLQIAVAIRMYVGMFESPDITELRRQRFAAVEYFWQRPASPSRLPLSYKHYDFLCGCFFGKSWRNIVAIGSSRLTPEDLRTIRLRCPNLKRLILSGANVSPELLEELAQCRQLVSLNLNHANVDDAAVQSLTTLKSLIKLDLSETLVGNDVLAALEEFPQLRAIDLTMTDVTQSALIDWKYRTERLSLIAQGRTDESLETETYGSLRWSDGTRSPGIPTSVNYRWDVFDENGLTSRKTSASGLTRRELVFVTDAKSDGTTTRNLSIGGYDAEPVTIIRKNGKTSTPWVEFRLPCTREQALKQRQR